MRRRRFGLKHNYWIVDEYKGQLRVIMNRDLGMVRQTVKSWDVLPVSRVKELVAWLNRYIALVEPTEASVAKAGIRAGIRSTQRALEDLEASQ